MPYSSTKDLPEQTKGLSAKEKRAFMKAFNSAVAQGKSEAQAFKIAWAAAKKTNGDSAMETAEGIVTKPHKFAPQPDKPSLCASCNKSREKGPHSTSDSASSDSFHDTMTALRRAVRNDLGRRAYLVDAGDDWLVYERYDEDASEYVMYRRSWSAEGEGVKLGDDAAEVLRKTVYVPVAKQDSAAGLVGIWGANFATGFAQPTRADVAKAKSQTPHAFQAQPSNTSVCAVCNRAKGDTLHTSED